MYNDFILTMFNFRTKKSHLSLLASIFLIFVFFVQSACTVKADEKIDISPQLATTTEATFEKPPCDCDSLVDSLNVFQEEHQKGKVSSEEYESYPVGSQASANILLEKVYSPRQRIVFKVINPEPLWFPSLARSHLG